MAGAGIFRKNVDTYTKGATVRILLQCGENTEYLQLQHCTLQGENTETTSYRVFFSRRFLVPKWAFAAQDSQVSDQRELE